MFTGLTFICIFFPLSITLNRLVPNHMRRNVFIGISALFLLLCDLPSAVCMGVLTVLTLFFVRMQGQLRIKRHVFIAVSMLLLVLYAGAFVGYFLFTYHRLTEENLFLRFCPFGMAFFTLQGMRLVAELFMDKIGIHISLTDAASYLLFYPRLAMGPVQTYAEHTAMWKNAAINGENLSDGLALFVLGLSKKILIADTIGLVFLPLYGNAEIEPSVVLSWVMMLAFSLHFFFTVSGYADMAKGISLCYGLRLPESYGYPLFSGSPSAFGMQWNKSVVSWCKECTAPLLRTRRWQFVLGMMGAWALLGLWYRPVPQMLIWGIWMGFWIGMSRYVENRLRQLPSLLESVVLIPISFCGWAIFSASSLSDGVRMLGCMFGGSGSILRETDLYFLQSGGLILLIALYSATGHFKGLLLQAGQNAVLSKMYASVRSVLLMILLLLCLAAIVSQGELTYML